MSPVSALVRPKLFVPGEGNPLATLLPRYATAHPALKPDSLKQLEIVVHQVREFGVDTTDEIFRLERFEEFVRWLVITPKTRGTAPGETRSLRTVKGKRDALWTLWKFAWKKQLCDGPPPDRDDLAEIRPSKENPVAWDPDQIRKIIDQARTARRVKWWGPQHWLSFLCTQWYSVERVTGLLSCTWDDLEGDVLHVRGARTKDKDPGVHRLPPWLTDVIRALRVLSLPAPPEKAQLIWPFPYKLNALRARYRRDILKAAGLPHTRKHLFHCIRRSGITEMVNVAGEAAAQKLARHSTPSMTRNYIDEGKLRGPCAADLLPNPARPVSKQLTLL